MNRRRLTLLSLVAGATLTLTACGGAATDPAASPGTSEPAAPATPTEDAGAPATPDTQPAPGAEDTAIDVRPEGQELVLTAGSSTTILWTLPDEGESVFRSAAVRPGSTADDLTVVVVTSAEGTYDLRWLAVVDGQPGELTLFPEAYRIAADAGTMADAPTLVWSPDGRSIAWLEPGEGGPTLRTVGWADGPGTGDTADDNASFVLDGVPADAHAVAWTDEGDTIDLRVETADGMAYTAVMERQADGALALLRVDTATR